MKNEVQISDSFDQEERVLLMISEFIKTVKPKHLPDLENLLAGRTYCSVARRQGSSPLLLL
jgi:hypothetical protein